MVDSVEKLQGDWDFDFHCAYGDEIVVEEYFSNDFPVNAVLEKKGSCWSSEIFATFSKDVDAPDMNACFGLDVPHRREHYGLNAYVEAYNSLVEFSKKMAEDSGLESKVFEVKTDRDFVRR